MPGIEIDGTGATIHSTTNGLNGKPAVKSTGPAAVEVTPARLQKVVIGELYQNVPTLTTTSYQIRVSSSPMHLSMANGCKRSQRLTYLVSASGIKIWAEQATYCQIDPSTGKSFSKVASVDRHDFQRAIKSASAAQTQFYESTTATQRGVLLRKWFDAIVANSKDRNVMLPVPINEHTADAFFLQLRQYSALRTARLLRKQKERSCMPQVSFRGLRKRRHGRMETLFHRRQRIPLS